MAAEASFADETRVVPDDWASFPIVGHFDRAHAVAIPGELLRSDLGDGVHVLAREHRCGWGGSACQGSSPSFEEVRVGALDERGVPELAVPYRCAEGACALEALALRKSPDAKTYVLTMRTDHEAPLLAFTHVTRPSPTPPAAPRSTNAAAPLFGLAAFAVVAVAALVARRARRRSQA